MSDIALKAAELQQKANQIKSKLKKAFKQLDTEPEQKKLLFKELKKGEKESKIDFVSALLKLGPDLSIRNIQVSDEPLKNPWVVRSKQNQDGQSERINTASSFASMGSSRSALQKIGLFNRTQRIDNPAGPKKNAFNVKDSIEERIEEQVAYETMQPLDLQKGIQNPEEKQVKDEIKFVDNPHCKSPMNARARKIVKDSDNEEINRLADRFVNEKGPMFKALLTHIDPNLSKGKKYLGSTMQNHQDIHKDLEVPDKQFVRRNEEDHPNLNGKEQPGNDFFVDKWKQKKQAQLSPFKQKFQSDYIDKYLKERQIYSKDDINTMKQIVKLLNEREVDIRILNYFKKSILQNFDQADGEASTEQTTITQQQFKVFKDNIFKKGQLDEECDIAIQAFITEEKSQLVNLNKLVSIIELYNFTPHHVKKDRNKSSDLYLALSSNQKTQYDPENFKKLTITDRNLEILAMKVNERFSTVKNAFRFFDINQNLSISFLEFMAGLDSLCMKIPEEQARDMFKGLDKNGNGDLSYAEFCNLTEERRRGIDPFQSQINTQSRSVGRNIEFVQNQRKNTQDSDQLSTLTKKSSPKSFYNQHWKQQRSNIDSYLKNVQVSDLEELTMLTLGKKQVGSSKKIIEKMRQGAQIPSSMKNRTFGISSRHFKTENDSSINDLMEQTYTKEALGEKIKTKANISLHESNRREHKRSFHTKSSALRNLSVRSQFEKNERQRSLENTKAQLGLPNIEKKGQEQIKRIQDLMNPTYENIPSTFKQNKMSFMTNQHQKGASSRDLSARSKLDNHHHQQYQGRNDRSTLLSQRQYQTIDDREQLNKTVQEKNEKMLEEIHKMRKKIVKDHELSKEGQSLLNKKQRKDFMAEYFEAKKSLK